MSSAALRLRDPTLGQRIDVATYHAMGRDSRLDPEARVELLDGEILEMSPIGPAHADVVDELAQPQLWSPVAEAIRLRVQNPVRLDSFSEPQPDLLILRARFGNYRVSHPTPTDVLLLVEVADTTLLTDRAQKLPLYGRHGIVEVWLVNIPARLVEVYRGPVAGVYPAPEVVRSGLLRPLLLPEVAIDVEALWGLPQSTAA